MTRSASVPVPASLAAIFGALGFKLTVTAELDDGAELGPRELESLRRAGLAFNAQHPPVAPGESAAASPDLMAELRTFEAERAARQAPASAPPAPPARATGTGGE